MLWYLYMHHVTLVMIHVQLISVCLQMTMIEELSMLSASFLKILE